MQKTKVKFRSTKVMQKLEPLHIPQNSFNQKFQTHLNHNSQEINNDEKRTEQDNISDAITIKRRRKSDELNQSRDIIPTEENMNGGSHEGNFADINNVSNELVAPYQFIGVSQPSFRTIILPHFAFKTITFFVSVIMLLMFVSIFVIYQVRPQTETSWGCLLYETQNKFYPRLRMYYEFWRVFVSGLFHSNISHLILNLVGIQLYGYFVEWYLGKWKFVRLVLVSLVNSHFMSCLTNMRTVSTTSSGILYSLLGVKILFFIKYRGYELLDSKKYALYGLLGLVFCINVIVLFVGANVDIGGHVGGLLTGLIYGGVFYYKGEGEGDGEGQEGGKRKMVKYGLMSGMVLLTLGLVGGSFIVQMSDIDEVNTLIDNVC